MPRVEVEIPDTPPSVNRIGFRSHWAVGQRAKEDWQGQITFAARQACLPPGLGYVVVRANLRFPQRRRRDASNYIPLLDKAAGDALQVMKAIPDDTAAYYRFDGVTIDEATGPPLTKITFDYEENTCHSSSSSTPT